MDQIIIGLFMILVSIISGLLLLEKLNIGVFTNINLHSINLPSFQQINISINSLPWIILVGKTLFLTLISSGIAIGSAPLLMLLFPYERYLRILSLIWTFLRLIPPPLSALIILLISNPSIWVAALALGLNSLGVMGRLLKEKIEQQDNTQLDIIKSTGAGSRISWLYGQMIVQAKSYLAYASYRTEVILKETTIVGLVGGSGLGWQLNESLSSFNWAEVLIVVFFFSLTTLIVESISDLSRNILKVTSINSYSPI